MNLQKAQSLILNILDSQNPKGIWESRKLALLTAFLPILAWPTPDAPRGSLDHLLNLEELVKRANLRTGDPEDLTWVPVYQYLITMPGMQITASGALDFADKAQATETFEYITKFKSNSQHAEML